MKYIVEQITHGDDELILKYQTVNSEVKNILNFISLAQMKLVGVSSGVKIIVDPMSVLYVESVDRKTFICTADDVIQVEYTLQQMERILNTINFIRCSKSMIINIDKISCVKSLASNRIDATMCSGEHIMISRTYASDFRRRLKGGGSDE